MCINRNKATRSPEISRQQVQKLTPQFVFLYIYWIQIPTVPIYYCFSKQKNILFYISRIYFFQKCWKQHKCKKNITPPPKPPPHLICLRSKIRTREQKIILDIQIPTVPIYYLEKPPPIYSNGHKHFTLIDEKTSIPLSVRGAYIATTAPYLNIWCLQYFPLIQRRQRNRHTHLPMNLPARFYTVPRVHPGCHPGHGTTCSGYKHFTLIDEKTSITLSVRGAYIATTAPYLNMAYIATTAPYLNIWCLQRNCHIYSTHINMHVLSFILIF